jgi:predicted RNA-binding Zn ribbon-like protein
MSVPARIVDHEFRLDLGHPVLELLATLAGRRGEPCERLTTPGDLDRWLDVTGLASGSACNKDSLESARELREAIYRVIASARASGGASASDLHVVNEWARQPTPSPQLDRKLRVRSAGPDPCRAALAQLARAAVELVAGPELARIRNCANGSCSLMFIDRSRPGRRRWCSMERCGNRAKTARYRQRRRQSTRRDSKLREQ